MSQSVAMPSRWTSRGDAVDGAFVDGQGVDDRLETALAGVARGSPWTATSGDVGLAGAGRP